MDTSHKERDIFLRHLRKDLDKSIDDIFNKSIRTWIDILENEREASLSELVWLAAYLEKKSENLLELNSIRYFRYDSGARINDTSAS